MPPLLLPVAPVTTQRVFARISDGSAERLDWYEEPVQPASTRASGAELRRARALGGRTIREAGALLGLGASQVCDLEAGALVFAHDHERRAYIAALEAE